MNKDLKINKKEFKFFLEFTKKLNFHGIIPLLSGSLGLSRIIGEFKKVEDVDVFLKKNALDKKRDVVTKALHKEGFELIDQEKYEFKKEEVIVSIEDIDRTEIPVDFEKINVSREKGAEFYELSAEDYLAFYQLMLKKEDRKKKRKEDEKKITLIKEHISKKKNNKT